MLPKIPRSIKCGSEEAGGKLDSISQVAFLYGRVHTPNFPGKLVVQGAYCTRVDPIDVGCQKHDVRRRPATRKVIYILYMIYVDAPNFAVTVVVNIVIITIAITNCC